MPVGNIGRVTTVFTGLVGGPAYNNLFFEVGDVGGEDYVALVNAMWQDCAPLIHVACTWTVQGEVPVLDSATGNVVRVDSGDDETGAGAANGEPLPLFTQGLVRLRTGQYAGGREIRGRMFVPYPIEGVNAGSGVPVASYRTDLAAAVGQLLDGSSANGAWVVWSRKNGRYEYVTSVSVWDQWAVLRSRRP